MTADPQAPSGAVLRWSRRLVAVPLVLCALVASPAFAQNELNRSDLNRDISDLLLRLESALATGDPAQFLALVSPTADRKEAEIFARDVVQPGITRAVVRERDRAPITDRPADKNAAADKSTEKKDDDINAVRLIVEVFLQSGTRGAVSTWRLDLVREPPANAGANAPHWSIEVQDRLTTVEGLYKLTLNATRQYRVRNLQVTAEDITLAMPQGIAFAADTDVGSTAFVLIGQGTMTFQPKPASERGQIKLLAGEDVLRTPFNGAFVRMNPSDLPARFTPGALVEEKVIDRSALNRAQEIFDEEVSKSFNLDLSDLSRELWSLVPPMGDMLAEVRTGRFGTLTYTMSGNESEDISLFDRKKRRNISAYASERKLATRERFYSENEEIDYDVQHYDVQSHFSPEREWLEGRTVLRLRVKAYILGTLTLRLAESLVVQSVTSPRFGRLLSLRVKGQNSILVNLPIPLARGDELTLAVTYAGRLGTATPEREVIAADQDQPDGVIRSELAVPPEPRMLYTNRSYWYPQSTVTDFATASMRLTVPESLGIVATGAPAAGNPVRMAGDPPRRLYVFAATQPTRYLAVVITRLGAAVVTDTLRLTNPTTTLARNTPQPPPSSAAPQTEQTPTTPGTALPPPTAPLEKPTREGVFYDALDLQIVGNPRQTGRVRAYSEQVSSILSRYADIVGDLPFPSFTLTLVDDQLPGGHSPAYFALLHQPLPTANYTWRNDPVSFDKFPEFFVAHELAHQFWGDAVGGENYHEQWISEGFAQFFALLYAEKTRPRGAFEGILKQMRRTSESYDRYGPVWLGYRLGHLQGDSRIFRALVYNKGALVLHMLRRLLGDEVFFRGLRRFYLDSRFIKVGTDDVRRAFEKEAGRSLEQFFERWIMESGIPQLVVTHTVNSVGTSGDIDGTNASTRPAASASIGIRPLANMSAAGQAPANAEAQATPYGSVTVRLEQKGQLFEYPVTIRLRYGSDDYDDVVVPVAERTTERTIPLKGRLQSLVVNDDDAALVDVVDR